MLGRSSATTRWTRCTTLTHLLPFIGYPRTLNGLQALDAVAPAAENPAVHRAVTVTGVHQTHSVKETRT